MSVSSYECDALLCQLQATCYCIDNMAREFPVLLMLYFSLEFFVVRTRILIMVQ